MIAGIFRKVAAAVAMLALLAQVSLAQQAETRFAFVIGNDGYEQGALPTAANDAALVADALRVAGFDVTGARNLDQDTFRASYREFLAKVAAAGPGAVAAIYVAGYGVQLEGENYFVPVGAVINRETDIGLQAIRIADLTRPLAGLNGRGGIILLDLAYDTPFAKQGQGLAPGLALVEADTGTLIGLNAAPGMAAPAGQPPYGAYAQAISEMIRVGNLNADEIMDRVRMRVVDLTQNSQVPWHQSRIAPPLVLLERGAEAPPPQVSQDKIDRLQTGAIKDLGPQEGYAAVLKRDQMDDYKAYVEAYPDARETKRVRAMMAARREALFWARTTAKHTPAAYWTYLKRYPRGPHANDAQRRLTRLSQPVDVPPDFAAMEYDVEPPPPEESMYFEARVPTYFDRSEPAPVAIIDDYARPPQWWAPPPPPVFEDEDDYFLPAPQVVAPVPDWVAPPSYVAEPIMPYGGPERGVGDVLRSAAPYVAIPAALAAGIAAGKLISRNKNRNVAPIGGMPPTGGMQQPGAIPQGAPNVAVAPQPGTRGPRPMPPVSLPPGQTHAAPGTRVNTPGGRRPTTPGLIPPVQAPTTAAPQTTTAPIVPPTGQPPRPTTMPTPAPTTTLPPVTQPPVTTTRPPVTQPPVTTTRPPVPTTTAPAQTTTAPVVPPTGQPPRPTTMPTPAPTTTLPPVTQPPVTTTRPPVTQPPVTTTRPPVPATTAPAQTTTAPVVPPTGQPPRPTTMPTPAPTTTLPPVTQPPVTTTRPPVTQPPVTTTRPPVTQPPVTTTRPPVPTTQPVVQPRPVVAPTQTAPPTVQSRPTQMPAVTAPPAASGAAIEAQRRAQEAQRQQQLQQQRTQDAQRQQQQLQQQRTQDAQRQQQLQQQRTQDAQRQQQQVQQQRAAEQARQQQQLQQQRQQQQIQQQQQRQQQQIQQQQRQQQAIQQQQRQQQAIQQQQRQQQMLQQQRQQQQIQQQQQQRQQQMMQQQRQQQMLQQQQQQRQQQMLQQQRQQQQQRRCGLPGLPPCR